ncbi:hypothetical protein Tco_1322251, partial [Tanacetum coccineum]
VFMDEDKAGPDPGVSRVALVGPNPEPTYEEFMANVYPDVHESLKFPADEHVILEEPLSSSGTLSFMKNLDDAYTIGDQFINDKSTKDELGKLNVKSEVVSMVIVPIHQASSSVPPLSIPIIDLSPPKLVSSTTQAQVFTATPVITTTTLPPPPQQQSTTESELAARVTTLEKKLSDLEQKNKNLDNTSQNLGSRVFTLELRDLPYKIDETIHEAMKEGMFETGTYKSLPEHVDLYEALEASMKRANKDEFFAENDKSRKRRPWKTTDTREAPLCSSKQQSSPHSKQPVEDVPMPYTANISDSKDTNFAHLPKIKQRTKQLKPIPEEDRPETPEPDWIRKKKLSKSDLEGPAYKDPEYLISGDKGRRSTLSISKLKAAQYLDFGLEELVLSL